MNDKSLIEAFVNDEAMAQAVHSVLQDAFLKGKGQRDVQILAAERLAIDLLEGAWRDLERYKSPSEGSPSKKISGL